MQGHRIPRARIVAAIPIERVDLTLGDGESRPRIGGVVELDHGFTTSAGEPAGIVLCLNADRSVRWVADVLESEMEVLP